MKRFLLLLFMLLAGMNSQAQTVRPEPGMWYNPARSGHGFDLNFYEQDTMAVVWYTYDKQGMPIWYQAAGPYDANTWQADLYRYKWDGSSATPTAVGTIELDFSDSRHASLQWSIDYGQGPETGSEPVELLIAERGIPAENYSGHWFDPDEPGWGMTVGNQGEVEFAVLYFYDGNGDPTWALGATQLGGAKAVVNHDMRSYRGFCPGCTYEGTSSEVIGSLTRDFTSQQHGSTSYRMELNNGLSGVFERSNSHVAMASDPITVEDLAMQRMEFFMGLSGLDSTIGYAQSASSEALSLVGTPGYLTCPEITTESGTRFVIDWGDGCVGPDGIERSGKATLEISNYQASLSSVSGTQTITWEDYREDGQLMLDGVMESEFDLNGSAGVYDGTIRLTFVSFYSAGTVLNGTIVLELNGLNAMATNPGDAYDSLVYRYDNFSVDGLVLNGTVTLVPESSHPGELYRLTITIDLENTGETLQGEILMVWETETRFVVNTTEPLMFGPDSFEMNDVVYDLELCYDYPISGTVSWTENGVTYSMTYDGSCSQPPLVIN